MDIQWYKHSDGQKNKHTVKHTFRLQSSIMQPDTHSKRRLTNNQANTWTDRGRTYSQISRRTEGQPYNQVNVQTESAIDMQWDSHWEGHAKIVTHIKTDKHSNVEKGRYPLTQTFKRTIAQTYSQTNIQILIQTERKTDMQTGKHSVGQKAYIQ